MSSRHEEFLRAGRYLRNWSPATLRTYRQGLGSLGEELPTKASLTAWVIRLRERGLTPGGINMYARTVNSYLTWLHEEGHVDARLRVTLLRAPAEVYTLLTATEVRALLHQSARSFVERRARLLTLLLVDTGGPHHRSPDPRAT